MLFDEGLSTIFQFNYVLPADHLLNDGTLTNVTTWKFESVNLPPLPGGAKLKIQSTYDKSFGGVGLDNIILQTPQKLVP